MRATYFDGAMLPHENRFRKYWMVLEIDNIPLINNDNMSCEGVMALQSVYWKIFTDVFNKF